MTHSAALAAVLLAAATPLAAQGITGGQLGIEYNAPIDGSDLGGTTYHGGLEYAFNRAFTASVNAAGYRLDNFDTSAGNVTLHGTYALSGAASAGLFVARDSLDDEDATLFGIEGGTEAYPGLTAGGYLGAVRGDGYDGTILGIEGDYGLRSNVSLIGDADLISGDGLDVGQIALGASYTIDSGPRFTAKVGQARIDDGTTDETFAFISVGVDVAFGNQRGTTFDTRSIFDVIPGF